jgi:hypothetical protein
MTCRAVMNHCGAHQHLTCRPTLQGKCALDAEHVAKLFTMDVVDQMEEKEFLFERALQVMMDCLALSAPCV